MDDRERFHRQGPDRDGVERDDRVRGLDDARRDGAVFDPTNVRTRGRPPLLATGLALGLVSLVGLGVLDAASGQRPSSRPDGAAASEPAARATPTRRPSGTDSIAGTALSTPAPDVLELDLRPAGSHLVVHGDVYSPRVMQVIVALEDPTGEVMDVRFARLIDGPPSTGLGGGARFDVHFGVPDEFMGEGLWVVATAFSAVGEQLDSIRRPVVSESLLVVS
jgi:hypothetical protein